MLGDQDTIQGWEPEGPRNLVEKGKTQSPQRHVVCAERQRTGAAKRDANKEKRRKAGHQFDADQGARIRELCASRAVRLGVVCNMHA